MRHIHPAALVGLFLNFALSWMLFSVIESADLSGFTGQDQEFMGELIAAVATLKAIYIGVLAFQALALGLIASRIKFGIILAGIAAFFMLPGSLIYFIGAMFSHDRVKYAAFAEAPAGYSGALLIFRAYAIKKMLLFAGAALIFFLTILLAGWGDVAILFFSLTLAGLFFAFRASKNHALSLHNGCFTLTPGVFSRCLLVPYSSVNLATLCEDESIHFQVQTPDGVVILVWSLRTVDPKERRAALEKLGAALASHNVPLQ